MVVERVLKSRRVRDYALMSLGLVMTAWALDVFLIPNQIAAGGVVGSGDRHLLLGRRRTSGSICPSASRCSS